MKFILTVALTASAFQATSAFRTSTSGGLVKRQQLGPSDFPPECVNDCQAYEQANNNCSDDQCFCTDPNIASFAQCLNCIANLSGDVADLQDQINQIAQGCTAEGFPVSPVTITGSGNSGPAPASSSRASSAAPAPAQSSAVAPAPAPVASSSRPTVSQPSISTRVAQGNSAASIPAASTPAAASNPSASTGGDKPLLAAGLPSRSVSWLNVSLVAVAIGFIGFF